MNHNDVQRTLDVIRTTYSKILDGSQEVVLPMAKEEVRTSKEAYDIKKRNRARGILLPTWGYTIDHHFPLRFRPSKVKGLDLQVDIYCDVRWQDESIPVTQDIKVRVWSEHRETIYNSKRDSEIIGAELENPTRTQNGRVISRMHFDKANPEQNGPKYHFQVGGKAEEYELSWHPNSVNVPRLEYHPLELFLTCQMVAANFFYDEYLEIKRRSEWIYTLKLCQKHLLLDHYQRCLDVLSREESLLDSLWMI